MAHYILCFADCGLQHVSSFPIEQKKDRTESDKFVICSMKKDKKKQRFHEALLQMLYPPPPPPRKEDNHESVDPLNEALHFDGFPDESECGRESPSSSSRDEGEEEGDGSKKLTRAQRKRLRKKKLKEAASRRRKIIGPILPGSKDDDGGEANGDVLEKGPPCVRRNASDVLPDDNTGSNKPESEEAPPCSKRNKQKHRRFSKKLADERLKSSSLEDRGHVVSKKGECSTISSDLSAEELDT